MLPVNLARKMGWRQLVEKPAGSKEPDAQTVAITRMRKLASRGMATTSCLLLGSPFVVSQAMTNSELFSNVQVLLRKAIASRLEMPRAEYDSSLDHKNAVNVFLTDVMSIAYNNGNDAAVLEELSTLHHYGEEDTPEVIEFVTKQIIFAKTKLSAEIAAFAKMHEMNQAKMAPEVTWETVQKMVSIAKEYEDCDT